MLLLYSVRVPGGEGQLIYTRTQFRVSGAEGGPSTVYLNLGVYCSGCSHNFTQV